MTIRSLNLCTLIYFQQKTVHIINLVLIEARLMTHTTMMLPLLLMALMCLLKHFLMTVFDLIVMATGLGINELRSSLRLILLRMFQKSKKNVKTYG